MKRHPAGIVAALLTLAAPASVWAQLNTGAASPQGPIAIREHPQKAVYNSPAEWPQIPDCQGHWRPGQNLDPLQMSHLHTAAVLPLYGVITGRLRIPVRVQMFHVDGQLSLFNVSGPAFATWDYDVVWDGTGTSTPPTVAGNPSGLVTLTGVITIDPTDWPQKHGWANISIATRVNFRNGDSLTLAAMYPVWSALDTTVPPNTTPFPITCDIFTESARGASPDSQAIRVWDKIPLEPISSPWLLRATEGTRYGRRNLEDELVDGVLQVIKNPDLHNYDEGTSLYEEEGHLKVVRDVVLHPGQLGADAIRAMIRWVQPLPKTTHFAGDEEVHVLLTLPVRTSAYTPPAQPPPGDGDRDGVTDDRDTCPNTPTGTAVDHHTGCPIGSPAPADDKRTLREKLSAGGGSLFRLIAQMLLGGG